MIRFSARVPPNKRMQLSARSFWSAYLLGRRPTFLRSLGFWLRVGPPGGVRRDHGGRQVMRDPLDGMNGEAGSVPRKLGVAAASAGLAAATLAFLVPVVSARGEPSYSHVGQFISELGAKGAANASWVSAAGFAPIGLLVLVFLAFASLLLPPFRLKLPALLCLGAVGAAYLISAVFPCDAGCPISGTFSQSVHNLFGLLEYLGALVGLLVLGAGLRGLPAWRCLAFASVGAAGVVAVGFLAMLVPELGAVRGLSQRVAEAAIFSWVAYASIVLLRSGRAASV